MFRQRKLPELAEEMRMARAKLAGAKAELNKEEKENGNGTLKYDKLQKVVVEV